MVPMIPANPVAPSGPADPDPWVSGLGFTWRLADGVWGHPPAAAIGLRTTAASPPGPKQPRQQPQQLHPRAHTAADLASDVAAALPCPLVVDPLYGNDLNDPEYGSDRGGGREVDGAGEGLGAGGGLPGSGRSHVPVRHGSGGGGGRGGSEGAGCGLGGGGGGAAVSVPGALLGAGLLARLAAAFAPPGSGSTEGGGGGGSPYWSQHEYGSPDTPFFSYLYRLVRTVRAWRGGEGRPYSQEQPPGAAASSAWRQAVVRHVARDCCFAAVVPCVLLAPRRPYCAKPPCSAPMASSALRTRPTGPFTATAVGCAAKLAVGHCWRHAHHQPPTNCQRPAATPQEAS